MNRGIVLCSALALLSSSGALAGVAFTSVGRSVTVSTGAESSNLPGDFDFNAVVDGSNLPDGEVTDAAASLSGANMGSAGAQVVTSATSNMLLANLGASATAFAPDDGGYAYGDGYAEVNIFFSLSQDTTVNIMADVFAEAVGDGDPQGALTFGAGDGTRELLYSNAFGGPVSVNESFEVGPGVYHVRMFINLLAGFGEYRAGSEFLDAGTITALLKLTIPAPGALPALAGGLALGALRRRR